MDEKNKKSNYGYNREILVEKLVLSWEILNF